MKKRIYKFILKNLIGWKIEGNKTISQETIKKSVIITVPHTHWLDFYLGILTVINFLSNKSSVYEDISIISKMPKWIFLKQLF